MDYCRRKNEHQQFAGPAPDRMDEDWSWDWDPNGDFEVEKILDIKLFTNGTKKYLVKWMGWEDRFNSWESEDNVKNCQELIHEFEIEHREARSRKRCMLRGYNSDDLVPPEMRNAKRTKSSPSKPFAMKPKYGFDRKLKPEKILGVTLDEAGLCKFLIKWKNTNATEWVPASVANVRCPQHVIKFYEDRIVWNEGNQDANPQNYQSHEENMMPAKSD